MSNLTEYYEKIEELRMKRDALAGTYESIYVVDEEFNILVADNKIKCAKEIKEMDLDLKTYLDISMNIINKIKDYKDTEDEEKYLKKYIQLLKDINNLFIKILDTYEEYQLGHIDKCEG